MFFEPHRVPFLLAASVVILQAGCWSASSGLSGAGGAPVSGAGGMPAAMMTGPSCDAIGSEPTIPPACATVMATKTLTSSGIPADESTLDTAAIQSAIDGCTPGQAVRLAADGDNVALLSGALFLKSGVTLWIDTGVTLFSSRNPRDFDARPGQCGLTGSSGDCNALINASSVPDTGVVGTGTINGRGGEIMLGGTLSWWDQEDADNGNLVAPRLIWVRTGNNFVLFGVTLRNAPKFHVVIERTNGFKVWGITINTPSDSVNTDGVDPSASMNGVIAYNKITTGDDNIAIKASNAPITDNIVVAHNHFGKGHGMSIGSETNSGVQNVTVCDLSFDGSQNGLRIKSDSSRGGLVQQIRYTDICMRGVSNPLVFDSYYSSATGTLIPWFKDIFIQNVHNLGAGRLTFRGWDAAHTQSLVLDNVVFDNPPTNINASNTTITLGPGPVNVTPTGTNVKVIQAVSDATPPRDCTNAWVTF